MLKVAFAILLLGKLLPNLDLLSQGILYTGGRGWYRMCSRQPTVGLVVLKIKQKFSSAQTATF